MAVIYSYPDNPDLRLTDMLIGTSTIMVNGRKKNITKNFTLQALGDFLSINFGPPQSPTLQQVTLNGAITETTVYLNGGALSESINELATFQPDSISTVNTNTGSGTGLTSLGYLEMSADGVATGILATGYLTANVTLQYPNKPTGIYTIATTSDLSTGYIPYVGATQNVDLGEYELKVGQLTLDISPTGTAAVATTRWNNTTGTSETTLKGGNVILKNGVDLVARVVNKVTPNATLLRANYTAVRISGAQGQRLAVAYAQANNDNNSADTLGLVCENIATNQEGFIMTMGQFEEINTTGSLQGETWSDGDVLYLSPTTPGALTNIKPTGLTGHIVVMGYVEYAHANHGKIYVKIMNGWELDELHNVYINSPLNNDGLFYDSADSLWKNKTIAAALGYTPENVANKSTSTSLGTSDTLYPTQNAVKVYADTKFTLPSLTSGSVLFSNGTTIAQNNTNFFWNNSSIGLCLGGTTLDSNYILQVNGSKGIRISGTATGFGYNLLRGTESATFANNGSAGVFASTTTLTFNTASTERMRVNSSGNVLINTTTDAGFKLDVNGTARVKAQSALSTEVTFSVRNSADTRNFLVVNGAGDVYNNGAGGVTTNTFFGENSGRVTTGQSNTFFGNNAGASNTGGNFNSFFGISAGSANVGGLSNCFFGRISGFNNTNGSNNSFYGTQSGRFIADGVTNLTAVDNSVFIGFDTRANGNSQTNQIVIGHNAIGAGSNTATLGNTSIVDTILRGRINIQQYATGSRPTYVKGALIYDSTLGKLVVGGNLGWEVVTSM